jgi:hypothetical protein
MPAKIPSPEPASNHPGGEVIDQGAPTYDPEDFSRAAQRSTSRTDQLDDELAVLADEDGSR